MGMDLEQQLIDATEGLGLVIGENRWDLYVFGIVRAAHDWIVQLAIVGPRACMVTVRVTAVRGHAAAAREMITLVRAWILADDGTDHAFLECAPPAARAC
jgi:hypothetical protein